MNTMIGIIQLRKKKKKDRQSMVNEIVRNKSRKVPGITAPSFQLIGMYSYLTDLKMSSLGVVLDIGREVQIKQLLGVLPSLKMQKIEISYGIITQYCKKNCMECIIPPSDDVKDLEKAGTELAPAQKVKEILNLENWYLDGISQVMAPTGVVQPE